MNKAEYWILNSCVLTRYPLSLLVSPDIEIHFNRDGHGLAYSDLVQVLSHLFMRGDLVVRNLRRGLSDSAAFIPSTDEIEGALNNPQTFYGEGLYYGLSLQGGQNWEEFSKPKWDEYIAGSKSTIESESGELYLWNQEYASSDHELINQAFEIDMSRGYILRDMSRWEVFSPWEATYWKTLPTGYFVSFDYQYLEDDRITQKLRNKADARYRKLFWREWYSQPIFND